MTDPTAAFNRSELLKAAWVLDAENASREERFNRILRIAGHLLSVPASAVILKDAVGNNGLGFIPTQFAPLF